MTHSLLRGPAQVSASQLRQASLARPMAALGLMALPLLLGVGCSHAAPRAEVPLSVPRQNGSAAFRYDETTGECRNASGQTGLNALPPLADLKDGTRAKTGVDLECADLTGLDIDATFGPTYKTFPQWSLRGALFGEGSLRFLKFQAPDLRGARMEKSLLQYSEIGAARIDAFTKLPSNCPPAPANAPTGPYSCRR